MQTHERWYCLLCVLTVYYDNRFHKIGQTASFTVIDTILMLQYLHRIVFIIQQVT